MKRFRGLLSAVVVLLLALGTVAVLVLMNRGGDTYNSATMFVMDTTLDFTIQGRGDRKAEQDVDEALGLAKRLESYTSRFKKDSDVSKINASAGVKPVRVHPETLEVIESSLKLSEMTGGSFDITIAPVVELWGFYDGKYRVPAPDEIEKARRLVDYRKVIVDRAGGTVMLAQQGMAIDLGGIAKGYALGEMYRLLKSRGVENGLINFGGAVGAIGGRSDGKPWVVGIRSPRGGAGDLAGRIRLRDSFVSSSGDYERFFERDGKRYCHIFDPATGRQPAGVMSATVVGPDSSCDDVLSTALFVMGAERGLACLEGLKGYSGLVIDGSGRVVLSDDMKKHVMTAKDSV